MTDQELDDLFKQQFASHQLPVPDNMWSRVQPQPDRKRRGAIWWWSAIGMLAVLALIGTLSTTHFSPKSGIEKKQHSTSVQQSGDRQKTDKTHLSTQRKQKDLLPADDMSQEKNKHHHKELRSVFANQQQQPRYALIDQKTSRVRSNTNEAIAEEKTAQLRSDTFPIPYKTSATIGNWQHQQGYLSMNNQPSVNDSVDGVQVPLTDSNVITIQNNEDRNDTTTKTVASIPVVIKKADTRRALSLAVSAAGYRGSRRVYDIDKSNSTGLPVAQFDPKESHILQGYGLQVQIDKPISSHLSLISGIRFLHMQQSITYLRQTVREYSEINSLGFNTDTAFYAQISYERPALRSAYNSVNIPLLVSYHKQNEKIELGATAGVLINAFSWYNGEVPGYDYRDILEAENIYKTRMGTALYAGINASKRVGNWQLFAEPHVQSALSNITKPTAHFKQKFTTYGLGVGIRKSL